MSLYLGEKLVASSIIPSNIEIPPSTYFVGSYWFGKTKENTEIPSPTLQNQTYYDFTTNKVYISDSNLSWQEISSTALPEKTDLQVFISSKFWDIDEQENQHGGFAIYFSNKNEWQYYPSIFEMIDNSAVHKTGDETITGNKTYTNSYNMKRLSSERELEGVTDGYRVKDEYGYTWFFSGMNQYSDKYYNRIGVWRKDNTYFAEIGVGWDINGNAFTIAPTPATSDNSTQIATTAFVRNCIQTHGGSNIQVVDSVPSNPTSGVFYFIPE